MIIITFLVGVLFLGLIIVMNSKKQRQQSITKYIDRGISRLEKYINKED